MLFALRDLLTVMAEKDDNAVHHEGLSTHDAECYSDSEQNSIISRSDSLKESVQSDMSSVSSLLDRLRSPTPSILACKRKIQQNPPPNGIKRGKGGEKGDPKSISPSERVKA